jgi:hypothetical protein
MVCLLLDLMCQSAGLMASSEMLLTPYLALAVRARSEVLVLVQGCVGSWRYFEHVLRSLGIDRTEVRAAASAESGAKGGV